jgi:hypothetical protein
MLQLCGKFYITVNVHFTVERFTVSVNVRRLNFSSCAFRE